MVKDFRSSYKKVYDPVHGFIRFDEYEKMLMGSFAFQRLRHIHQLGGAYFVFPGATHSRLEHSLGVMELASRLYDRICNVVRPDLFHFVPRKYSAEFIYWKKILRLAALCHDLGHLPFSHVAEEELLGKDGHEKWTAKIITSDLLKPIFEEIQKKSFSPLQLSKKDIVKDVLKIALGEKVLKRVHPRKNYYFTNWEKILSEIISGDFFGADRIDYLLRDSKFTGVNYGLFDYLQLMEMITILPQDKEKKELELGIDENGIEPCEALIVARHFMHKRVYKYPSVLSYNFHLSRFMQKIYEKENILSSISKYLTQSDVNIIAALHSASKEKKHIGHEDAKKILTRKGCFKAIAISDNITEEKLLQFKKKNKIPTSKIYWKLGQKQQSIDLSFPVVKKYLIIKKAKECSNLLSKEILGNNHWVYIDPELEVSLVQFLEK